MHLLCILLYAVYNVHASTVCRCIEYTQYSMHLLCILLYVVYMHPLYILYASTACRCIEYTQWSMHLLCILLYAALGAIRTLRTISRFISSAKIYQNWYVKYAKNYIHSLPVPPPCFNRTVQRSCSGWKLVYLMKFRCRNMRFTWAASADMRCSFCWMAQNFSWKSSCRDQVRFIIDTPLYQPEIKVQFLMRPLRCLRAWKDGINGGRSVAYDGRVAGERGRNVSDSLPPLDCRSSNDAGRLMGSLSVLFSSRNSFF